MQPQTQALSQQRKSTNVRTSLQQRALQLTFRALPAGLAAPLAGKLWGTPPRAPVRPEQRALLEQAQRLHVEVAGTRVAVYGWGDGPAVMLIHGWGGHAGQLTAFVPGLIQAGFRVLAFDAPRHGATAGGTPSLPNFAACASAAAEAAGGIDAVIAHSMGASAAAYAMARSGLEPKRAVFVAPAATMSGAASRFADAVALAPEALDRMRASFEKRFGIRWDELEVVPAAPSMRAELLVIHDEGDREVPYGDGAAIAKAWPGATLHTTRELGHHRILRDPATVARAVAFAAGAQEQRR